MSEHSYIVRIYRRGKGDAISPARRRYDRMQLDGVVEEPATGRRTSFHGVEELWRLLVRSRARAERRQIT